ncbi:MAG: Mrp/NBP35 family ATP-binding protein [Parvularcula sp.]
MLNKIKRAARRGKSEKAIQNTLEHSSMAQKASLSIRETPDGIAATIVLAEDQTPEPAAIKELEQEISDIDGVSAATVVATAHNLAREDARRQSGHDNPLSLPGQKPPAQKPTRQRPGGAAQVIAVASGKGGVGKSTVAARLALALAAKGRRVGLLDLDIYGPSVPVLFGLEGTRPTLEGRSIKPLEARGLSVMSIGFLVEDEQAIAWRGPMVMGAAKQLLEDVAWPELDTLIIDTPPGTGDTHLTLLQRATLDGALIVSTPSPLAIADVRRGVSLFSQMGVPLLGLVENMSTLPDGSRPFGSGITPETLVALDLPRLAELPLDPAIGDLSSEANTAASAPEAFSDLATAIENRLAALDHGEIAP